MSSTSSDSEGPGVLLDDDDSRSEPALSQEADEDPQNDEEHTPENLSEYESEGIDDRDTEEIEADKDSELDGLSSEPAEELDPASSPDDASRELQGDEALVREWHSPQWVLSMT